jgi:hypothetical protein
MKKFASASRPFVTLVVALVMLFASLAALLVADSLRSQLEETQGQLQDTQGELQKMQGAKDRQEKAPKGGAGSARSQPSNLNNSQPTNSKSSTQEGQDQQQPILLGMQGNGGSWLPYLLLLVISASLVLVVTSGLKLLFGGSRLGRSGASTTSHTEMSNLGRESSLEDGRWMTLVEECVEVVDDLDEHMDSFDTPRREVAGHVILRLEDILERSGVEVISNDAIFDRARHKPDADHSGTGNGAAVRETLSPGFAVGPRVLRRARVQLE